MRWYKVNFETMQFRPMKTSPDTSSINIKVDSHGHIVRKKATCTDKEKATACQKTPTELPWEISHEYGDGFNIAHEIAPSCGRLAVIANVQYANVAYQPTRDEAKANAKLIVRAVNHADKLAEALREAREVIAEEYGATVASGSPLVHRIDAALAAYQSEVQS